MLPGQAIQPWDVLEIDLMSPDVKSLANNECLPVVVEKASRFPLAFPSPSNQTDGMARQLLQWCITFGLPRAIRANGGWEFTLPKLCADGWERILSIHPRVTHKNKAR